MMFVMQICPVKIDVKCS